MLLLSFLFELYPLLHTFYDRKGETHTSRRHVGISAVRGEQRSGGLTRVAICLPACILFNGLCGIFFPFLYNTRRGVLWNECV